MSTLSNVYFKSLTPSYTWANRKDVILYKFFLAGNMAACGSDNKCLPTVPQVFVNTILILIQFQNRKVTCTSQAYPYRLKVVGLEFLLFCFKISVRKLQQCQKVLAIATTRLWAWVMLPIEKQKVFNYPSALPQAQPCCWTIVGINQLENSQLFRYKQLWERTVRQYRS